MVVSFQVLPYKQQNPHHPLVIALVCENFPSCCHSEILPTLCYLSHHLVGALLSQIKRMGKVGRGFNFTLVNKDISLSSRSHASSKWMCLPFLQSNTCFISARQTLALKGSSYWFPVFYPAQSYSCISSRLPVSMCASR